MDNGKRYDFYFKFNNKGFIHETHGRQHYEKTGENSKFIKTLKEEQENDRIKKQLALNNGIKEENYIVIDCRKSELEFIKNNILKSRLNELFDLSKIDWLKAEEFALSNRVKEACELWNNIQIKNIKEIEIKMNLSKTTIIDYLKRGEKLGWTKYKTQYINREIRKQLSIEYYNKHPFENIKHISEKLNIPRRTLYTYLTEGSKEGLCMYDGETSMIKSNTNNGENNGIKIICVEISKKFNSITECAKYLKKKNNMYFDIPKISQCCKGIIKSYKGYTFRFIN